MNARDAIQLVLTSTEDLLKMYLGDFSDGDLVVRPVPGANHVAWQLGHLIEAECMMGKVVPGASYPELPAGWSERHNKAAAAKDPPAGFATKAEYLGLFDKVRHATRAAVAKLSDADLDRPTAGDMAKWAPTVGALLVLTGNHTMMHVGQFTAVRRKLGKPVLF